MSRIPQPSGTRGSLKWIQACVNSKPDILNREILPRIGASKIEWRSPLASDDYAEYRDNMFLERLGLPRLESALRDFWPQRGPQWDALALSDNGDVLLIEAKAHIDELCSPGTAASEESRARIEAALDRAISACGAKPKVKWTEAFYQLANRLAHLHFLRANGVPAWLVLVNFVRDSEMKGPNAQAEWEAAYRVVHHVMGLRADHPLSRHVLHVYPDIRVLA